MANISLLELVFGLIIFLFGLSQLEKGIRQLANTRFKQMLRRSTDGPVSSVVVGTFVTAIVQSSSMVSLIMLAMVGAGILPLMNAIGVILGANIGTTFTGWIVTTLGFKLNLAEFALPCIAAGGFLQLIAKEQHKSYQWGLIIFGLGLLLFGLQMMKTAVEALPDSIDLSVLKDWSVYWYFLFGIIVTALIQSSSATMLITLSALHAGIIDLPAAAAFMIGADMGTVNTIVIGAIKGPRVKKQLVLANIIFNLFVDIIALFVLLPLLPNIMEWFGLSDPLYTLVAFFTGFNVVGVLIFMPILRRFSAWVERVYPEKQAPEANAFLATQNEELPETAMLALRQESQRLYAKVLSFSQRSLNLPLINMSFAESLKLNDEPADYFEHYYHLKDLEGEIVAFAIRLQQQSLSKSQTAELDQLLVNSRDIVYAAKLFKSVNQDIELLTQLESQDVDKLVAKVQKQSSQLVQHLVGQMSKGLQHQHKIVDLINEQAEDIHKQFSKIQIKVRQLAAQEQIGDEQLSTLFNLMHSRHEACEHLLEGLQLLRLEA